MRQTPPVDRSVEELPFCIYLTQDIRCRSQQWITANRLTNIIGLIYCKSRDLWTHLQLGCILNRTCKLSVIHSFVTGSLLYIPQDFPLLVIIFFTFATTASHGSTNTLAGCDSIRIEPNAGRFLQYAPGGETAATQTAVSPPRRCNCSHRTYGHERTLHKGT